MPLQRRAEYFRHNSEKFQSIINSVSYKRVFEARVFLALQTVDRKMGMTDELAAMMGVNAANLTRAFNYGKIKPETFIKLMKALEEKHISIPKIPNSFAIAYTLADGLERQATQSKCKSWMKESPSALADAAALAATFLAEDQNYFAELCAKIEVDQIGSLWVTVDDWLPIVDRILLKGREILSGHTAADGEMLDWMKKSPPRRVARMAKLFNEHQEPMLWAAIFETYRLDSDLITNESRELFADVRSKPIPPEVLP